MEENNEGTDRLSLALMRIFEAAKLDNGDPIEFVGRSIDGSRRSDQYQTTSFGLDVCESVAEAYGLDRGLNPAEVALALVLGRSTLDALGGLKDAAIRSRDRYPDLMDPDVFAFDDAIHALVAGYLAERIEALRATGRYGSEYEIIFETIGRSIARRGIKRQFGSEPREAVVRTGDGGSMVFAPSMAEARAISDALEGRSKGDA